MNKKRLVLRILVYAPMVFLLLFILGAVVGPSSADIRLDTGDLRYRYLGIPVDYERMGEPRRTRLLGLARESDMIGNDWVRCADFPLSTTNNTDGMSVSFYMKAEAWIDVDQRIALMLLEDIAGYIRGTHADAGLPDGTALLHYAEWDDDNDGYRVRDGWRADEMVQDYLRARGLD